MVEFSWLGRFLMVEKAWMRRLILFNVGGFGGMFNVFSHGIGNPFSCGHLWGAMEVVWDLLVEIGVAVWDFSSNLIENSV